jgi:hypothetical protein
LEELLPKDNETIHLPLDGPVLPNEPQGFSAEQMIRCDECLRANPPTRVNCLYCGTALPLTEESARLRKPSLRQPEKHEVGFNSIFVSIANEGSITEASKLLRLAEDKLDDIINSKERLPLARTASPDEARLVVERLQELGITVQTLSDDELGLKPEAVVRPRSFTFQNESVVINHTGGRESVEIPWSSFRLIVSGRLFVSKVEVQERMSRKTEKEILDTSQFFSDELVFDLYADPHEQTWRIGATSFDFSCLQDEKTLVSGENLNRLRGVIASRAPNCRRDDSYLEVRQRLECVWPMEQETYSQGWRRERPGKYSLGAATVNSNETQFTRYSRLLRYFEFKMENVSR